MAPAPDLSRALTFLTRLKRHNNRPWFEAHRADYEAARGDFEALVGAIIDSCRSFEQLGGLAPKDCVMRIYRDMRFSPDKTPYKTNFAAQIRPGGKKSSRLPYYLHLQPKGESLIAGGLYMPSTPQLTTFRQAIADDARPFKRIIAARSFKQHFGGLQGESLKTAPKGFPRDHPEMALLRRTQVVVWEEYTDAVVTSPGFVSRVVAGFAALKPFLDYLSRAIGGN